MLYIGCHLSGAKGYLTMGKTAVEIGANVIQFFTRNPRGGKAKAQDPEDVAAFLAYSREHGLSHLLAHAPYTMNLCSGEESIRTFSREMMKDDLQKLQSLPGSMYNFHPGSHVKQGTETGIQLISQALNEILWPAMETTVLLETMAGKGSEVGGTFRELREILDRVTLPEKMGVCLDTCHIYDGGYDIVGNLEGVLEEFDREIGLENLRAVHLNDSKNQKGSRKDRHEKLGDGSLGLEAVERLINHPKLKGIPFYLETPNELPGYAREIALLKELYRG